MTKKQRKIWELEQYILKRQEAVSNFCDACATVLCAAFLWNGHHGDDRQCVPHARTDGTHGRKNTGQVSTPEYRGCGFRGESTELGARIPTKSPQLSSVIMEEPGTRLQIA